MNRSSSCFMNSTYYCASCFSISLDPEEETPDLELFSGLKTFLIEDFNDDERTTFFTVTLPSMAHRALDLKNLRPPSGLHFSLQQQSISASNSIFKNVFILWQYKVNLGHKENAECKLKITMKVILFLKKK